MSECKGCKGNYCEKKVRKENKKQKMDNKTITLNKSPKKAILIKKNEGSKQ